MPITPAFTDEQWARLAGTVTGTREPQELFSDETLEQALRQLTLYGPSGLPVLSEDREHVQGWITRHNILEALAQTVQILRAVDRARARSPQTSLQTIPHWPRTDQALH